MFIRSANKPSSSLSLDSTINLAKFKYNNVFVNKLVNISHNLTTYNVIFVLEFLSKIILT